MAVAEIHHSNQTDTSRENLKAKEKKERPSTKVIVRRLPPSMDQETFLVQVAPLPDYDYMYLVKGDMSLGENAYSRAYINFVNASDIFIFKEKFDNYVFVDHKGHEYPAVVEFATFQKFPRKRKPRQDPKCGTVESDPFYVEFLESLKAQPNQEQKPEYSYQFNIENKEALASTPLLEFIKQRRMDKLRIREERREQRKQRELERKKFREDEQKRRHEQKFPAKAVRGTKSLDTLTEHPFDGSEKNAEEENETSPEKSAASKDKKSYFSTKPRFFSHTDKSDFFEKRNEYKKVSSRKNEYNRDKEYRNRFDDYKKETPRKAKKYSEKREERKNEVRKKLEESFQETKEANEEKKENLDVATQESEVKNVQLEKHSSLEEDRDPKDGARDDPRTQRRIRNKDRPTMAIYQPGMLSKRKVDGSDGETTGTAV